MNNLKKKLILLHLGMLISWRKNNITRFQLISSFYNSISYIFTTVKHTDLLPAKVQLELNKILFKTYNKNFLATNHTLSKKEFFNLN